LKAAKKMAANAPVATCEETATAALVGLAPALEAAEPDPEAAVAEVAMLVTEVDDEAEEPLELLPTAVALRVPHFWLFLQVSCPCESFGCAATHCTKVCWQM